MFRRTGGDLPTRAPSLARDRRDRRGRARGRPPLLARVSAATLDSLATFETSREDLEEGADAEQVNEDGSDNEDGTNESSHARAGRSGIGRPMTGTRTRRSCGRPRAR